MRTTCLLLSLIVFVKAYEYGHYVEEGSYCKKRTGEKGICTHFSNCKSAILEVRNRGRPEICSFAGIYPIVCCKENHFQGQEETKTKPENNNNDYPYYIPFDESSISLKKCREYYSTSTQDNVIKEEHPHLALIGFEDEENVELLCRGTLISEEFVLLPAHCVVTQKDTPKFVRLGKIAIRNYSDLSGLQQFTIKRIYVHSKFDFRRKLNDIALVKLDRPVKFNSYIKPACLSVTKNLNGTDLEAPALKHFRSSDPGSGVLETDYFTYISKQDCDKFYTQRSIVDEMQICASTAPAKNCDESPGASLQRNNFFYEFNNFPEIVGIFSYANNCCQSCPDVFTRVSYYVSWIEKIVWS